MIVFLICITHTLLDLLHQLIFAAISAEGTTLSLVTTSISVEYRWFCVKTTTFTEGIDTSLGHILVTTHFFTQCFLCAYRKLLYKMG